MSNWKTYKIKDITTKVGSGATPRGGQKVYQESGTTLIRSQNVYDFSFEKDGLVFINEEAAEKLKNVTLYENDILLNITGDSVGRCCKVPREVLPARVNQHVAIIRTDRENSADFLMYALNEKSTKERLLNQVHGGTRKALTKGIIEDFNISIPDKVTQESIASVLKSLDDKIQINTKINKTLEEIALRLYKYWFVEFGPFKESTFKETELGSIPEELDIKRVDDLGDVVTGKTPSTKQMEYYNGHIPFIKIPDMHNNTFIVQTESTLSDLGANTQKNKMLPPLSVCVSCIATPGLVVLTTGYSQTNQQINSIICKEGISPYFTYLSMLNMSDTIISLGSGGTATLNLNKGDFSSIKILVPNTEKMNCFHQKVESIFEKIKINSINIYKLKEVRDYLLPRLINGDIEIQNAAEKVREVISNEQPEPSVRV